MTRQDRIFKTKEGDNFYCRRIESGVDDQERLKSDQPLTLIRRNGLRPERAAEIGACNGFRLARIAEEYNTECVAFEPSAKAVEDGRKKYPLVRFHENVAAKLDAPDGYFDLVIVYNILHWVDRRTLFRSVAEIDRILIDGGQLILGDFWVPFPQRRRYHHLSEQQVWTYKQNYWEIFSASRCYQMVDFITPSSRDREVQPKKVISFCALLKKSLTAAYPVVEE